MRVMAAGPSTTGRARRIAFIVWAAVLSLCFGVVFVGITMLTIGVRLADPSYTEAGIGSSPSRWRG